MQSSHGGAFVEFAVPKLIQTLRACKSCLHAGAALLPVLGLLVSWCCGQVMPESCPFSIRPLDYIVQLS